MENLSEIQSTSSSMETAAIFDVGKSPNFKKENENLSQEENGKIFVERKEKMHKFSTVDKFFQFKTPVVWRNALIFLVLHVGALYGFYLYLVEAMWLTKLWTFMFHIAGGLGITAGAHRLWAHRSYKALYPARLILVIFNCIALQNDVIEWSRDHRCHHKWSETDADPHDARRGLFFSHMGWLMMKKHPDVIKKGKSVDISDLTDDPLLQFQRRFYLPSVLLCCFLLPTIVPMIIWGESLWVAFYAAAVFRYTFTLNVTWTVNSIAHVYGFRPYDKTINPRENYVSVVATIGEGYHNYHHTFPQDYKASEYPWFINITTMFIDFLALIGWVSDRKVVSQEQVDARKEKTAKME